MEDDFGTHDLEQTPHKTGWTKVVGVITILYAALGLTCGGIGAVFLPIQNNMMRGLVDSAPVPDALRTGALDYAILGAGVLLALLLLFGGIMCTAGRPVSRWMCIVYALVTIPLSLANYLIQVGKRDALDEWAGRYPDTQLAEMLRLQQGGREIGEIVGLVILLVFGILIPAFYLVWFGLVKTKPEMYTGGDEGVV